MTKKMTATKNEVEKSIDEAEVPAVPTPTVNSSHFTPDWRWSRARYICDNGLPLSKGVDDDMVAICRQFIKLRKSGSVRSLEKLRRKFPNLYLASEIHEDYRNPMRWLLEGAILTEADEDMIGTFLCLHPEVVAIYENIFYNVRPFMYGPGLIYAYVICPAFRRAIVGADQDLILKLIGYSTNWKMYMNYCSGKALPKKEGDTLDGMIVCQLRKSAFQASMMREINSYSAGDIIEQYLNFRRIDIASSLMPFSGANDQEKIIHGALQAQAFKRIESFDDKKKVKEGSVFEPRAIDAMKTSENKDKTGAQNGD